MTKHDTEATQSFWNLLWKDPVQAIAEIRDAFDAWYRTRQWKRMLWFLPAFLLLLLCTTAILWGSLRSKEDLLQQYISLAEKEFPLDGSNTPERSKDESDEEAAEKEAARQQYAELIYRRILQLESNNKMARYWVANRMASSNLAQARVMMRELAPDREPGYAPAHAWTVMDIPRRNQAGETIEPAVFSHHLEQATLWEKAPANVLVTYSQLLESKGKIDEAIAIVRRLVADQPQFRLLIAEICKRHGREAQSKEELSQLMSFFIQRLSTIQEKDDDRVHLARAYLFLNDLKKAKDVLAEGLDQNPNRPAVRRALSDVLVLEYRSTIRKTDDAVEANMNLLNVALNIDPTNPRAGEEVAQLAAAGANVDDKTLHMLVDQVSKGQATAVTNLVLANAYMKQGKLAEAIGNWELCLTKNPNMVLALNNLAVALTRIDPPQFERALQMIERALSIAGPDAELYDSKGTILLAAGKRFDAITAFETSIKIQPMRVATRQKIIDAYEAEGMTQEASAQKEILGRVEKLLEDQAARKTQEETPTETK